MSDVLGDGIFTADHDKWHSQRKAASRIFTRNSFMTNIQTNVISHVDTMIDVLRGHAKSGEEIDLAALFFLLTLDSFVGMAFGSELGSMQSGTPVPFATAFDFAQQRSAYAHAETTADASQCPTASSSPPGSSPSCSRPTEPSSAPRSRSSSAYRSHSTC